MVDVPLTDTANLPALPDDPGQFILYQTEDGRTRVEVRIFRETVWLSLNQMADLFQRDKSVISRHIANVFEEDELDRAATVAEFATVQTEGPRQVERRIEYYNLDVIISVGYRVKSHRGTQFRIWATQRLREYLIKGFALDDQRLKQAGGGNYFSEFTKIMLNTNDSLGVLFYEREHLFYISHGRKSRHCIHPCCASVVVSGTVREDSCCIARATRI